MCRGNYRSSWAAEGGYDFVAEALFSELAVDGFFLEYDDERSGGFEPLRFVPEGKQVVLGLVTTKSGALEDKDTLKRRIDEASKYVPLDQLCLSPQCGFSSTVEGNALTLDEELAKLPAGRRDRPGGLGLTTVLWPGPKVLASRCTRARSWKQGGSGPSQRSGTMADSMRGRTTGDLVVGGLVVLLRMVILGHTAIATTVSILFLGWLMFAVGVVTLAATLPDSAGGLLDRGGRRRADDRPRHRVPAAHQRRGGDPDPGRRSTVPDLRAGPAGAGRSRPRGAGPLILPER